MPHINWDLVATIALGYAAGRLLWNVVTWLASKIR